MDRSAEPRPAALELTAGTRIGRYIVERGLGRGGMGVVYAALDTELGRDVALKIVRPRAEVDAMQARLRREAKAMARLSHRHVVPVFDIGTHDGQLFIAMELIAGDTLRSWVTSPRPWQSVVQLFAKAGRGLEAAHAAGLVHRDFKPDNVMVAPDDDPRITDFGLARDSYEDSGADGSLVALRDNGLSQVTATGSLAGTPAYMAPEHLLGGQSGPRADQFSFCVSLFEVLYGARPFHARTGRTDALIAEIRAGRVVKPAVTRGVPRWLHAAIVRGLAFDPDDRWPSMHALVEALERGRRRRLGVGVLLAVLALGVAAAGLSGQDRTAPPRCRDVVARGNDAVTILVCKDEYTRTSDPEVGARLADALRRTGHRAEAATLARELLATTASADALYTLGWIASEEGHPGEAERSLRLAGEQHRKAQQWGDAATDFLALARISIDVVDKLAGFDQAAVAARRAGDARTEAYCHVVGGLRLSEIGAQSSALGEMKRAGPVMMAPSDQVLLDLQLGNVYQNLDDNASALPVFARALAGAQTLALARQALSARLNLAYSLAESGRLNDAGAQLDAARALDPGDEKLADRLSLEARIAASGGDLARAAGLVDRAIQATDPKAREDLLDLEVQRAEIALQQGEFAIAEQWARRAIARIATLRSAQPPAELRSWLITDRRIPYELLFASLAKRGDAAGALAVFDGHRGLDVLAGLAHGDDARSPLSGPTAAEPAGLAFPVADLARLVPALATSALATPSPPARLVEAARSASLLVFVVARGEVWRITADGGQLGIARIRALSALRPRIDQLHAQPGDRAAAALGDLLVPPEIARPSDRVLHVVLDEPLAELPVTALRVGGHPLFAARTVVQPARPSDLGCTVRPDAPRPVVVIDASGERAAAASRAALFGVPRGDLLQLAAPIESDALGDALVLRDGRVRALEIAGHGGSPAQVVLTAPAAGPGGTRALAMAFLAAGADQVIASVRPVTAAVAARLAERLYRADPIDLARALARVQADADGTSDGDAWLGFAAFGRATCNPQP